MTINEQETALRRLLEPAAETQGSLSTTIAASVAISLKRIADALERPAVPVSTLTFDPNSASGFRVANTFGGNQ